MYLCVCKGIRLAEAVEAAKQRGCSPDALTETWGFDEPNVCGRCLREIERISGLVELKLDGVLAEAQAGWLGVTQSTEAGVQAAFGGR